MNLYRVTFQAELLVEGVDEDDALAQVAAQDWDMKPVLELIGDADEVADRG